MPDPAKLAMVADGAKIRALLPYLEAEIAQMQVRIANQADGALASGAMTPDLAVQLWVESTTLKRLLQKMGQKMTIGAAVGEDLGPDMDLLRS